MQKKSVLDKETPQDEQEKNHTVKHKKGPATTVERLGNTPKTTKTKDADTKVTQSIGSKNLLCDIEIVLVLEKAGIKQEQLTKLLNISAIELKKLVNLYNETSRKKNGALLISHLEKRYELSINPNHESPVLEHYKKKKKQLSDQSLETIAIIAYQQPITKAEVDKIRGANSAGPIKLLLTEQLIHQVGIKQAPGSPSLYATTKKFLHHFALNSLNELPPLEEVKNYSFLKNSKESN